jgi:hypothetical protein
MEKSVRGIESREERPMKRVLRMKAGKKNA